MSRIVPLASALAAGALTLAVTPIWGALAVAAITLGHLR